MVHKNVTIYFLMAHFF